ncbi:MAG: PLP-dependent aminotransferase family protein [Oscillospiraceae bacterium]
MDILTIRLSADKTQPLYQQLYKYISTRISDGEIKSGEKLPSKRALASHLAISLNTVDTAYQMLVAEGFAEARPKSGFYVCKIETLEQSILSIRIYSEKKPSDPNCKFSFKTNSIDTSLFPYKTWARIQRDILTSHPEFLNHGDRDGDIELRRSIARYLHEYRGVVCSEDRIIVGAGIEYLVGLLANLFYPKCFALENPGYKRVFNILKNNNIPVCFVPVDENGLVVSSLAESASDIVYVTPSHQFPTGATMPMSRRAELLSWANQSDERYIIEDDYDSEFRFDTKPIPALQGLDSGDKVIYISTFSRIIAPSIRIAYMVLPKSLTADYTRLFSSYSSTVSRFEQHTLCRFIDDGHFSRHLNRVRVAYRSRRDFLIKTLLDHFGKEQIKISGAHTGLHLLVQVLNGMDESELVRSAANAGVKLTGISAYYMGGKIRSEATVILGYSALKEEEISKACDLLKLTWS